VFQLIKYRCDVLRKLVPFAAGMQRYFTANLFLTVMLLAVDFIVPLLYKEFIEETIIAGRFETFVPILAGYVLLHLLTVGISYAKNYNGNCIRNHVSFQVKLKLWNNLFREECSQYEHLNIGDVKMHLEDDVTALSNFSGYYTIDYLIQLVTMFACAGCLFVMEWRLALFSVICIPLTIKLDSVLGRREMFLNDEQRSNDQSMNTWLYHSLQGWKEIKAFHLEKKQEVLFTRHIKKYAMYYAKWINYWTLRVLIIPKLRNEFCMKFGLYFIGGLLVMNGTMSIGNLLVFATYFELLTQAVLNVSKTDADLQGKKVYVDRLFGELEKEYAEETGCEIAGIHSIVLKNIHYNYPGQDEVLRGITLSIRQGERVAIVGRSGCGKSTLLKILTGMLEPCEGSVEYSGVDRKKIRESEVYKKIGFIMQSNRLYNMSIRENLLLGNPKATEEEIKEACKKACILDDILNLPDGFETVIGEGGNKLSGGQKQRIVLARTFLRDVDVFVFDEATSALDQYSEKIINDAIANVGKDKIVIIVAHRESSIRMCDRIIQLAG